MAGADVEVSVSRDITSWQRGQDGDRRACGPGLHARTSRWRLGRGLIVAAGSEDGI
jgi:hypothetical protein